MVQYIGIAFPFRKGPNAFPAVATDDDLIKNSIEQIMGTQKGERVMRPNFGANVFRFVFANNNDLLADLISTETRTALGTYEPRIIVQQVDQQQVENEVTTTISYVVRSTGQKNAIDFSQPSPR